MSERIQSFREFWPYYLSEHRNPVCRGLHYVGTTCAISLLLSAVLLQRPGLLLAAAVSGYFFAWVGHFFVEKNRPATFTYPVWSLGADFLMYGKFVTGQLGSDPDFQARCGETS